MKDIKKSNIEGYLRNDGRKGIRNQLLVVYLVECAHHVAREIASDFKAQGVQLIGFSGCYPSSYAYRIMRELCTHPNTGGVLLVSLGCESFDSESLAAEIQESGRPVHTLIIQQEGGTRLTIDAGKQWVSGALGELATYSRVPMDVSELIIGTICGGSDATSGITANPSIGRAFDLFVKAGAAAIFEETGELIGCEDVLETRALTPELGVALRASVEKAARYYTIMGHGSFAPGNADGGLTTQEEKSLGAYSKSGDSPISGILKPGDRPSEGGLYLLDVVPDGEPRFGYPNINDNVEIAELAACGAHLILFSTGRGSVVGAAVSPVMKICGNPETYARMSEDMDINSGRVITGEATLDELGEEIYNLSLDIANGIPTVSEALGHQEFVLGYKSFEPTGPTCHPSNS